MSKGKKIRIAAAILMSIVMLVSAGALLFSAKAEGGLVTTEKTAAWTVNQDRTVNVGEELQINISEQQTAGSTTVPKILFLGSMCGNHGLKASTVTTAIETCATYGNVDYYLFRRYKTVERDKDATKATISGSLLKGSSLSDAQETTITKGLSGGYHATLYDFAKAIVDTQDEKYDFIVLEFDGMYLGALDTDAAALLDSEAYAGYLSDAAEIMADYYERDKVAWIIASKSNGTYIFGDSYFDSTSDYSTNTRKSIYLLAPEDLIDDNGESTVSGNLAAQTHFIARISKTSSDNIWV